MIDIRRRTAMYGTLILFSTSGMAVFVFCISHPAPEQNTTIKASLLEVFMLNFQIMGIGNTSSTTSIMVLSIVEPRKVRLGSRQWPGIAGSQAL